MLTPEDQEIIRRVFDHLVCAIGARPTGSPENDDVAEWLDHLLRTFGLETERIPFEAQPARPYDDNASLIDHSNNNATIRAKSFLESVGDTQVTGPLHSHGGTHIWSIHGWEVWRIGDPVAHAYIAGRTEGPMITQHLPEFSAPIPHVIVGPNDIGELRRMTARGATVTLNTTPAPPRTNAFSLLGRNPNTDGDARPLIVGHFDTVPNTPGAYDNAGGVAIVAAMAARVAAGSLVADVLLTNGEELGLLGARAYGNTFKNRESNACPPFVINVDGTGRGKQFEIWLGHEDIQATIGVPLSKFMEKYQDHRLLYRHPAPPGSDHTAFHELGIPSLMLTINDLSIIHSPDDGWDEAKLRNAEMIAGALLAIFPSMGGRRSQLNV